LLLPVKEFEAQLPGAVAHLLEDRQRYALAARRSILQRSWPAICDELLGHYEAVLSPIARARMARRRHAQGE
jgi:phosphatidylinositol alpha 1,6-mannosyltransferase